MHVRVNNIYRNSFPLIMGATLALVILWLYWPVIVDLFNRLMEGEDYSFGLLLPLVAGYIIYLKWPRLRDGDWQPDWTGLVIIVLALGLYILGQVGTNRFFKCISLIMLLGGVTLSVGGFPLLKLLAFPLFLLLLMIPPPSLIVSGMSLKLKLISSRLATEFLRAAGYPVFLQGNIIDLGTRQLQVVEACSGLRYILSLVTLTFIFCYFFQRRLFKAAILFLAVIPMAVLANALRAAAMGIFPVLQAGFWHDFTGWLIFMLAFVLLFGTNWLLNRWQPPGPLTAAPVSQKGAATQKRKTTAIPHLLTALVLVVATAPIIDYLSLVPPLPMPKGFDQFPMQLGSWHGKHAYIDPEMVKATGADAYLNAEFTNPGKGTVGLWITYYKNMEIGGIGHSPRYCMGGAGWQILSSEIVQFCQNKKANCLLMQLGNQRILSFYWHFVGGRWVSKEKLNKFYIMYDSIFRRRADGGLVRLTTQLTSGNEQEAKEILSDFAAQVSPVIVDFFPK